MKGIIALCMALMLALGGTAAAMEGASAALSPELLEQLAGEDDVAVAPEAPPEGRSAALSDELLNAMLSGAQTEPEPQLPPAPLGPEQPDEPALYEAEIRYVEEEVALDDPAALAWRGHAISVDLFTRDVAQVNISPTPAHGYLVLIRLKGDAPIAYADIERNTGDFVLANEAGNLGKPLYWRVRGVSFLNGVLTTDTLQNDFELIYLVSDDVPMEALRLMVATGNPGEYGMIPLT